MRNGRVLQNTMAEVENMRAVVKGGQNPGNRAFQRFAAGHQSQRIKIALHRQTFG